MTESKEPRASVTKKGKLLVQPGQPLEFMDVQDTDTSDDAAISVATTIGRSLAAYMKAARTLLSGSPTVPRPIQRKSRSPLTSYTCGT